MKPIIFTLLIFQLLIWQLSLGQNDICGTDYLHRSMMQNDSAYRQHMADLNSKVRYIIQNKKEGLDKSGPISIPVVVHVIHLGEPIGSGTNISDNQIYEAIDGLNDYYNNDNGFGVDMGIEFCLAETDPNWQPSSGINRVDGSFLVNYALNGISMIYSNCDAASEDSVKDLSRWSVTEFYNIWVVNAICKSTSGIQGVAYFPYGGENDGTVIKSSRMTRYATTLAHEIGHGFNLHHTFNGCCDGSNYKCPLNVDCTTDGDQICDTPPHRQNDCGSTNPCSSGGIWDNSRYNFMSYCIQKDRFTPDQKDRLEATLLVYPRENLKYSPRCTGQTGIEQLTSSLHISVYPNPSRGDYNIKIDDTISNFTLKVYNSIGELINTYVSNKSSLDFSITSPKGIYLIQVSTDNRYSEMLKVIKYD